MKIKHFTLGLIITIFCLVANNSYAVNKVIVIPLESSSSSANSHFNINMDNITRSMVTLNWSLAGVSQSEIIFRTVNGYYLLINHANSEDVQAVTLYYSAVSCSGSSWSSGARGHVVRNNESLYYFAQDANLITTSTIYLSKKENGICIDSVGEELPSISFIRPILVNDSGITGITIATPSSVQVIPQS